MSIPIAKYYTDGADLCLSIEVGGVSGQRSEDGIDEGGDVRPTTGSVRTHL